MDQTPRNNDVPQSPSIAFSQEDGRVLAKVGHGGVRVAIWRRYLPPLVKSFCTKIEGDSEALEKVRVAMLGALEYDPEKGLLIRLRGQEAPQRYEDALRASISGVGTHEEREAFMAHHMTSLRTALASLYEAKLRESGYEGGGHGFLHTKVITKMSGIGDATRGYGNSHNDPTHTLLFNYGKFGAAFPGPARHWGNTIRAVGSAIVSRITGKEQKFRYFSCKPISKWLNISPKPFFLGPGDVASFNHTVHHANPEAQSSQEVGHSRLVFVVDVGKIGFKNFGGGKVMPATDLIL